ncbi:unnamed protein product [Rhizoctonia solani]|uniref:NmrA-like domain-containing protein n=1 Tax=Rhizoctonia solani TaxID=456999 RepID=A0A8H2WA32_9AGAM|nr:unnamed protein product [Rhizoctonia solani]
MEPFYLAPFYLAPSYLCPLPRILSLSFVELPVHKVQVLFALKTQGVEVVHCDLVNKDHVRAALTGVYAVFGVTSWEQGEELEVIQGKNLADAAKVAGVKHFLWSSALHIDGEAPRHWESKVEVNAYLHKLGVPTTTIIAPSYYQNLWSFFALKRQPDGPLVLDWSIPSEVRIASFSVEDLGAWIMVALKNPGVWIGKQMKICSEVLTPRDYATKLSSGLGTKVSLKEVSITEFENLRPYVPPNMWLSIKGLLDHSHITDEDVEQSKKLFPGLQNLEMFTKVHGDKIVAAAVSR